MLKVTNLHKTYPNGLNALKGINLEVHKGEFLVIIGLSGSGKSTLLRCMNRLLDFTQGEIVFENNPISKLTGKSLRQLRARIGMIFQHFNLIERYSVKSNVLTGALQRVGTFQSIFGLYPQHEINKALDLISVVGLNGKESTRLSSLSGGQKQRVAIARALMQNPALILADEPVASLDPATSHSILDYLRKINTEHGVTIVCNLYFLSLVREYATRVVALKAGEVVFTGGPQDITAEWFKKIYGEDAKEVTIK